MSEIIAAQQLNFYSKYNRVRDKQNIASLYFLIDDTQEYIEHLENMTFTLNMSKEDHKENQHQPKGKHYKEKLKNINILESFDKDQQEHEQQQKRLQLAQKLKKLQRLQKQFYDQLDKSEKNYKIKKQLRDQQRRQRQKYRKQLINVIQQQSQNSPPSKSSSKYSQEPKYSQNQQKNSQINQIQEFQDYYKDAPDFQIQDYDRHHNNLMIKEPKKKFKEIIQLQKEQKYVYSVDEQQEGKSSIVIERLNIQMKKKQSQEKPYHQKIFQHKNADLKAENEQELQTQHHKEPHKVNKNFYEIQLTHSQSQNIIRKYQQPQQQQKQQQNKSKQQIKQELDVDMNQHQQQFLQSPYNQLINYQTGDVIPQFNQNINKDLQFSNKESNFQEQNLMIYNEKVQTPINNLQNIDNMAFNLQDPSDIIEEIDDKVSIDNFLDQQNIKRNNYNTKNAQESTTPIIFRSHAQHRKTFDNQQEVKSITQSLDFHPFQNPNLQNHRKPPIQEENPLLSILKSMQNDKDDQIENSPQINNKKSSFKKLMASNRSNLVPRLAISTILNQHINQALGDFKSKDNILPSLVPIQIQQVPKDISLHIIKQVQPAPKKTSNKMNFKKMITQKQKLNSSREINFNRNSQKNEKNKKLLMNFFDSN